LTVSARHCANYREHPVDRLMRYLGVCLIVVGVLFALAELGWLAVSGA
jgi:hypothetical protein